MTMNRFRTGQAVQGRTGGGSICGGERSGLQECLHGVGCRAAGGCRREERREWSNEAAHDCIAESPPTANVFVSAAAVPSLSVPSPLTVMS